MIGRRGALRVDVGSRGHYFVPDADPGAQRSAGVGVDGQEALPEDAVVLPECKDKYVVVPGNLLKSIWPLGFG